MATSHRPQDTLSKRVKPLIRRSSGSTRAAPPAPAPRRKTVSPLVPAPAATPAAVSRAGTTCQHLRTGPAQAKPPQQPLSARARDNEARAYLHAPTPRDSRSVPSDSVKCHSDRAVRPLRFSRRRPRRADHHRHPGSVGWRGPMHGGCYGEHSPYKFLKIAPRSLGMGRYGGHFLLQGGDFQRFGNH